MPIMERAKAAVDCLSKASLTTLKSFAQPPGNCVYVTNACMILFGIKGKQVPHSTVPLDRPTVPLDRPTLLHHSTVPHSRIGRLARR